MQRFYERARATVRLAMSMILKTLFPESVTTSRSPSASALIPAAHEELLVDSLEQKNVWSLVQYGFKNLIYEPQPSSY